MLTSTKKKLVLDEKQPWLLIDVMFKGQCTDPVKKSVSDANGKMCSLPNNLTHVFQPLDRSVNKSYKSFLRKETQSWYSMQIEKQLKGAKNNPGDQC